MKTQPQTLLVLLLLLAGAPPTLGQAFNSGSDGSFGPINLTASDLTLDLPPDGVIHATTVSVSAGRTLRFRPNALNTPVFLLATGDVIIAGSVNISGERGTSTAGGRGGPGGFDGGMPGSAGTPPGDGHGPGAGRAGQNNTTTEGAGHGVYASAISLGQSTRHGTPYGSALLIPLLGGSGGGGTEGTPGWGGGGGGGAILIASNTRIQVNGRIDSFGGSWSGSAFNGGSGGAIRLVAPVVAGTGTLDVRGGANSAHGRIRVDTLDRSGLNFSFQSTAGAAVGSLLLVQPTPLPRLDLVEVAGTAVPEGSGPVQIILPFGAPAAQTVKVRARDFGQTVPMRLVLTPDSGASRSYDFEINNAAANPAEATVNVEFPANTSTRVAVWTR